MTDVLIVLGIALATVLLAFTLSLVVNFALPWCVRHWGKTLSILVIMLWLGSMMMAGLKTHYDPAVHDYVTSNFWGYAAILGTFPVFLPLFLWDKPTQPQKPKKSKPQPLSPGRLTLPSTYFMPYCVCPNCDSETLHWMEKSRFAGADVSRQCRSCGYQWEQRVGLLANEVG